MALSISQLTTPPTRSETTQWLIDRLQELGFQTTGWQEGRIQHSILNMVATVASGFAQVSAQTVAAVFNSYATGAALTLFSRSRFSEERTAAVKTAGAMTFSSTATGPYTVGVGELVVQDPQGREFVSTSAGTIPAGGSAQLNMEAAVAGADSRMANDATLVLVTPLAGVTVTNPSPGDDGEGNPLPWYNIATGADAQSDTELKDTNSTKWGTLATEKTRTAYEHVALKSTPSVVKVTIDDANPRGDGTVDVYVGGALAVLGHGDMATVQGYFADRTFQTETDWPPTNTPAPSTVEVKTPPTQELALVGTVYSDPQYEVATVQANLQQRLDDFLTLMPIGGKSYDPGPSNAITLGDIMQTIEGTEGVRSVTLSDPSATTNPPAGNVAVGPTSLVVPPSDWFSGLVITPVVS